MHRALCLSGAHCGACVIPWNDVCAMGVELSIVQHIHMPLQFGNMGQASYLLEQSLSTYFAANREICIWLLEMGSHARFFFMKNGDSAHNQPKEAENNPLSRLSLNSAIISRHKSFMKGDLQICSNTEPKK